MSEISKWDSFVDWFEYAVLRRLGLVRLETHIVETTFYRDWLIDLAKNEPISEQEKKNILAMKVDDE